MTRKERDELKAMIDRLRAEASKASSMSSRRVFDLTDPVMNFIALAQTKPRRRGTGRN